MTEKSTLLHELKIDKDADAVALSEAKKIRWAAGFMVVALCSFGGYRLLHASGTADVGDAGNVKALAPELARSGSPVGTTSILDASGYLVARRQATVSAKMTGRLVQVYADVGQYVKEGQILAKLDDSNIQAALLQAKASLLQAEAAVQQAATAVDDADPSYRRDEKLAEAGMISKDALSISKGNYNARLNALLVARAGAKVQQAAIEVAQRNLDDTVVRAPFAGLLTSRNAQPGEIVSPLSAGGGFTRTGIGTLVDMTSLEAEVDVNENFIGRVKLGASVTMKLNAYPDLTIPAHVIALVPTADRAKGTIKVRIGFQTRDPRLIPEMGVRVAFGSDSPGRS